ncbi:hypothetical protein C0991_010769, partial [Blastosporella zonata]
VVVDVIEDIHLTRAMDDFLQEIAAFNGPAQFETAPIVRESPYALYPIFTHPQRPGFDSWEELAKTCFTIGALTIASYSPDTTAAPQEGPAVVQQPAEPNLELNIPDSTVIQEPAQGVPIPEIELEPTGKPSRDAAAHARRLGKPVPKIGCVRVKTQKARKKASDDL